MNAIGYSRNAGMILSHCGFDSPMLALETPLALFHRVIEQVELVAASTKIITMPATGSSLAEIHWRGLEC